TEAFASKLQQSSTCPTTNNPKAITPNHHRRAILRNKCNTPKPRPHLPQNPRKNADVWQLVWQHCAAVGYVARRASVVWIVLIVAVKQGRDVSDVKIG
ncbi:hypothetical protein JI435_141210, partial [Parastagonospora nodorum SN15]